MTQGAAKVIVIYYPHVRGYLYETDRTPSHDEFSTSRDAAGQPPDRCDFGGRIIQEQHGKSLMEHARHRHRLRERPGHVRRSLFAVHNRTYASMAKSCDHL